MSVQFEPPKGLNQAHLGSFWATQRTSLPRVRAVQPIATTNEDFGGPGQWLPPSLQLALTNEPDCRLQMTSEDDQWMWQLQRNRLVVNWRKRSNAYPRFSATRDRFQAAWVTWSAFLAEMQIPSPKPQLWELTYVNRIPKDKLWASPGDWPSVLPGLWGGAFATVQGAALRGFHGQWVWESIDPRARLYVEPKPGRSTEESNEEVMLLSLTARGPVDGPNSSVSIAADRIHDGISFGHRFIVETFDRIASDNAKIIWGRNADFD